MRPSTQADGTWFAGPGVAVVATGLAGGRLDLTKPITVTVDVSALPAGAEGCSRST